MTARASAGLWDNEMGRLARIGQPITVLGAGSDCPPGSVDEPGSCSTTMTFPITFTIDGQQTRRWLLSVLLCLVGCRPPMFCCPSKTTQHTETSPLSHVSADLCLSWNDFQGYEIVNENEHHDCIVVDNHPGKFCCPR